MESFLANLARLLCKCCGVNKRAFVQRFAAAGRIDLLECAYQQRGILKHQGDESGERFFIDRVLPGLLPQAPCVFDVGANIGDFSAKIRQSFPTAAIHAFEPNPNAATQFEARFGAAVALNVAAVGDQLGVANLFCPSDATKSTHGSLHGGVLTELHGYSDVQSIPTPIITLTDYCRDHQIDTIDFLKLDTEGNEYSALGGARELIAQRKIGVIQFEFNEMNVVSRVFLKDFVEALANYALFRLDTAALLPLRYTPREEVFQFQNFVAVGRWNPQWLAQCDRHSARAPR